jgi:hypothetical protein
MSIWVLLAPTVSSDEMALPALREARMMFWTWFFAGLVSVVVISLVVATIILPFARSFRRREGSQAWGALWAFCLMAIFPIAFLVLAVSTFAFTLSAPYSNETKVVAIEGVTLENSATAQLSAGIGFDQTSRLAGHYISTNAGVWDLWGHPTQRVVRSNAGEISDYVVRNGDVLLTIVGTNVYEVGPEYQNLVAELPFAGMRFGQIKRSYGAASSLLLWGNHIAKSYVYELRADGHYAKLVDANGELFGAASCDDRFYAATRTDVFQLRAGFEPVHLFHVPGNDPVTSILARGDEFDGGEFCILLVATANAIYALQGGVATMILAGMGGNLGAIEDENLSFTLVDYNRNAAAEVWFEQTGAH